MNETEKPNNSISSKSASESSKSPVYNLERKDLKAPSSRTDLNHRLRPGMVERKWPREQPQSQQRDLNDNGIPSPQQMCSTSLNTQQQSSSQQYDSHRNGSTTTSRLHGNITQKTNTRKISEKADSGKKKNVGIYDDDNDDDLVKSMTALSTKDDDELDPDTSILECTANPLDKVSLQDQFAKYESMRGGCGIQFVDTTKALIVFGHPSTARRAWEESKHNATMQIHAYKGPMDIVENTTPVRKSTVNNRPRPTNMVARRLIHGALGMKPPPKPTERVNKQRPKSSED